MRYNESVSKKSSLHEAFEALKIELKDSYVRYQTLQKEREEERARLNGELERRTREYEAAMRTKTNLDEKRPGVGIDEVQRQEVVV